MWSGYKRNINIISNQMTKSRGSNEIVIVFKINFYFLKFKSSSQGRGNPPSVHHNSLFFIHHLR